MCTSLNTPLQISKHKLIGRRICANSKFMPKYYHTKSQSIRETQVKARRLRLQEARAAEPARSRFAMHQARTRLIHTLRLQRSYTPTLQREESREKNAWSAEGEKARLPRSDP